MSATGFQRRRRELAALNAKKKEALSANTGGGCESGFAAMSKKAIIELAKGKNLYDKSFEKLSKEALVPAFIEAAKAKIVEEGKKTAEEAAILSENELLAFLNNVVNEEFNIETGAGNGIATLEKDELIRYAEQQNIYDESFKDLEKDALLQKIFETVRGKVIEAGLKTVEEISALPEKELFEIFATISK